MSFTRELDSIGQVTSRFVYGTKGHVPDYMVKGDSTYRFITDHLGSVRLVVNIESGHVAQCMDYDEFGNVLVNTNEGFQPFGYAGGLFDVETGLVRFGARDYDAVVGRWTAKDPVGFMKNLNLYIYVHNNPIINIDPFGLWTLECCNNLEIKTEPTAEKTKRSPRVKNVYHPIAIAQFTVTKALALSWVSPSGIGAKLPSSKYLTQERITEEQWVHGVQTTYICHDPAYWQPKVFFKAEKGNEYWVFLSSKEIYAWVYWDWRDLDTRYTYGDPNEITYF